MPFTSVTTYDVLDCALGRLATVLERFDVAEEHFTRAHAIHEQMPAPFYLARTKLAWATMCLRRDEPGDRDRARELVTQALDLAANGDFASVTHDGTRLLEQIAATKSI
jgi:hypothetical protein